MTDREIALNQALIAVIGAVRESSDDFDRIVQRAESLLIDNSTYRIVEHPHVNNALTEIKKAVEFKK
ncbi:MULTISPECIES: hypothetical protein [Edwardsiella]|uniref:Uncharacterized protein n=2 Tax=Edwardsiella anguillarum TaxID=1821960 RepID=A0A076LVR1_9GAMM|nr:MULTISPECIES: hypothetical protein [Edwardsiella]AIJ10543.1 Hypothetical protein ETEE_4137 [Edwardsiella anguillarum ET080813]AKR78018.1 hypothetical protein AAZ33_10525 [Edwardsiella sp. LADL05-105]KAB0587619.1 hypothetical protein F7P84_17440 [Edwardsiella anguillarum]MDA6077480.1 hypothetical protein [Edwardsiella anguillarum]WHP82378.1 hypothetical protein MQ095_11215 [Edwardsiella anguillarum]